MNFFESQLRRLFGDTEDARFIGRCCFIPADDGNLVKAEFVTQLRTRYCKRFTE